MTTTSHTASRSVDPWPCHRKPRKEWCDRAGKGDFMGHTCVPAPAVDAPFTKDELAEIAKRFTDQRGYDLDSHRRVMAEIDADEKKARDALRSAQIRRALVLRLHAHLTDEKESA